MLGPVTAKVYMQVDLTVLERVIFMTNKVATFLAHVLSSAFSVLPDSCSCCPHCSPVPMASVAGASGSSRMMRSRRAEFISPHFYNDLNKQ